MPDAETTLLMYVPVPLHRDGNGYRLEDQACNGLRLWAKHFDRLICIMPLANGAAPPQWVPLEHIGPARERIEFITLPEAFRPEQFIRALPGALRTLHPALRRADYIGFAIGGLIGDWGAVGALTAHRMGLPFYVWTDRVESELARRMAGTHPRLRRRVKERLLHRPMAWLEHAVIRRAALGLFHGAETYQHYRPYCRNPRIVHDLHIRREDHITAEALRARIERCNERPLQIVYVGRADASKGIRDWLDVLERAAARGLDFQARWLGDGPELEPMRAHVRAAGLESRISLPGFIRDRGAVRDALQDAHVMLFCHKTPESPRCLLEALTLGCPILGYDGGFAADLISENGGGQVAAPDDNAALAQMLIALDADRPGLAQLTQAAAADGARFDDESVFRHRSDLIKAHLLRAR